MIEITEEQAEALIHQGPCRMARELGVETVRLPSEGCCPFCDLVRILKKDEKIFNGFGDTFVQKDE